LTRATPHLQHAPDRGTAVPRSAMTAIFTGRTTGPGSCDRPIICADTAWTVRRD